LERFEADFKVQKAGKRYGKPVAWSEFPQSLLSKSSRSPHEFPEAS
jgi:hypothetical protein